jgi:hypothetical protein
MAASRVNWSPLSAPALVLLGLISTLSGCARFISIDYQPANALKGQGTVEVGAFHYIPAEKGEVRPKQVQVNPHAAGSLYLTRDVAEFFAEAVRRELVSSGYQVDPHAPRSITASIERFYLDWVADADMTFGLSVTYAVREGDHITYTDTISCRSTKPKTLASDSAVVAAATRDCIVRFLRNAQEAKAL